MRFKIMRDDGSEFEIDPLSSNLSDTFVNELSHDELTVFGVAMVLVNNGVSRAASKLLAAKTRENLSKVFGPEHVEEILKAQPPYPYARGGTGVQYGDGNAQTNSFNGMYL